MEAAIVASALALGLAGAPHCTAMCSAPCAAVVGRAPGPVAWPLFHAARLMSYALAGAALAGGVASLGALTQWAPMLRPLWALVHAALLLLGLVLLWQGRQPLWLAARFAVGSARVPGTAGMPDGAAPAGPLALAATGQGGGGLAVASPGSASWRPMAGPAAWAAGPSRAGASVQAAAARRAVAAGSLWVAWPCGLLQSALLVAALSNSALGGAAAMAAFAAASSLGLILAPLVWRRLGQGAGAQRWEALAVRAAGALMAGMSGWALTAGVWHRVAEYCATL